MMLIDAPTATAEPCSRRAVPAGPSLSSQLSSGSNGLSSGAGSSNPPWLNGSPGELPVLKGHTQAIQSLTGPGSNPRTDRLFDIAGTDLGIAYKDAAGRTMLVFGDTMACDGSAGEWRSNTIMRTSDNNYTDGVTVEEALTERGYARQGRAREFIPSLKEPGVEHTVIPTAGITVNGVQYIDFMSVRSWGRPGEWFTNYAATVSSTDGENWTVVPGSQRANKGPSMPGGGQYRAGNERIQMSAFVEHDGYIYRFSTPSGRDGSAIVARAPKAQFPKEDAFEFFDGAGWSATPTRAAAVIDGSVSELSVAWNPYLGKFIALYIDGNGMVLRTADSPTGPWSSKRMLVDTATIGDLYGGFILPSNNDHNLYFVATTWSNYNVMVMRTNLSELFGVPLLASGDVNLDPVADDGLEVVEVLKPEQVAAATADDGVVTEDDVVTR